PAMLDGREVELLRQPALAMPFRNDFAVHAQARDAAVGIDVKPQMGERVRILDFEEILAVAFEFRFWQHLDPFGEGVVRCFRRSEARLEGAMRRKIAAKK